MRYPGPGHLYQVAVVGAGIAGSEVAWSCARAGLDVLLVTTSMDTVYNLFGERAALEPSPDTLMETLRASLAPDGGDVGAWALHRAAKQTLERTEGIHLLQSSVSGLSVEGDEVAGVRTWEGVDRRAERVVLAVGSFLRARLTVGELTETAGRLSEMAYDDLHDDLSGRGFVFREVRSRAGAQQGSLPYEVRFRAFAREEAHGRRLVRLSGLWATGACLRGETTYEEASEDGRDLARELISAQLG